ncbi:MAG: phosphate ABC transporter substrate-binding protein PstS [Chloroflexi bacterium]|nr:phosphate ABC transporter substrate-binding protein PstS [Chloroflexota bacterium]
MPKNLFVVFATLIVASLLLSACGAPAAAAGPVTIIQTQVVEKVVEKIVEVTPTLDASAPTALPDGSVQINGAGATFPAPVYADWAYAYQYVDPSVVVNYQAIGSGGGKKAIVDGTVDFAGSDSLLKAEEYTAGKDLQMYPTLAGAVVLIYNIKMAMAIPTPAAGAKALVLPAIVLDRATVVGIYNSTITKWNDPAILALNPAWKDYLPAADIVSVHRSDGSGTTEIFTKSLTSFSADWKAGGASAIEWPKGNNVGGKGNAGVAASVINTPNSIGYVELSYAKSNGLAFASIINQAGKTVVPSNDSVQAAMAEGKFDDKLTATIVDGKSDGAYPIAGYTYLILHTTSMTDCVKAQKTLEFFKWAMTDTTAVARASALGYATLPEAVKTSVFAKLAEVTCNGAPVLK